MKAKTATLCVLLLTPALAAAWWNEDWKERTEVVLNTSAAGVEIAAPVENLSVPLRLHSGNFDFSAARPDGSDLRVVGGDDQAPLPFWIERYDVRDELAVVWVQVPRIDPGTDRNVVYVYAGNAKAAAPQASGPPFDAATIRALHFSAQDGIAPEAIDVNGFIGPSGRSDGSGLGFASAAQAEVPAGGPFTFSLWSRPTAAAGALYRQGALELGFQEGKVVARIGSTTLGGGEVPEQMWSQIVLTRGAAGLALYVNGAQVARADAPDAPAVDGEARFGDGYVGLLDEAEWASTARDADWIKLAYASQSADPRLVATRVETPTTADAGAGHGSYLGILVQNLTPDAMAVIGLLAVMFVVAAWVMASKAWFVSRTANANRHFLSRFRQARDVLQLPAESALPPHVRKLYRSSSLFRLYQAGVRELDKRNVRPSEGAAPAQPLSGGSIDAIKVSIDADLVRESDVLNSQMVLLTIAISGGPFLGLLGTVIGVMITFASVAAAGEVNVNAIAPGIAAALLATVAGLVVAIPSLFGYNYLTSRIKSISSGMQIFADEFVARVAETYGAR